MNEAQSGEKMMIIGSPRSGTTWLGSIFDSHPDTLYLHEPDVMEAEPRLPHIWLDWRTVPPDEVVRQYVGRLAANRSLRSVFTRERFAKSYRSAPASALRAGLIRSARLADAAYPRIGRSQRMQVPDFARRPIGATVVKCVDSNTRLPAFARALPEMRFFFILRHPCGVARSKQRGAKLGKINPPPLRDPLFTLPGAQGTEPEEAREWPLVKRAAFEWAVANDWILTQTVDMPNVTLVNYDELADEPHEGTREMFRTAGLDFAPQTERYLDRLMGLDRGKGGYYAITRNPGEAANEWRQGLSDEEQEIVAETVAGTRAGAEFGF